MSLKAHTHRTIHNATFLLLFFSLLFSNASPARALGSGETVFSGFTDFLGAVREDEASILRGVYVADVFDLPVVQQPVGNAGYVSPHDGELTQFGMASQFGNVGLLAHNNLSGRFFSQLAIGQEVRLVYGSGKAEHFVITDIMQFEAFEPTSPYSTFRDLSTDEILSAEQVFKKVYGGDRHVTFQTCIAGPGSLSWGRLFVIAIPKSQLIATERLNPKPGR
ncbi:MAG TPA: hypothetical protein VGK56_14665 [Anaerolineales bacterium]